MSEARRSRYISRESQFQGGYSKSLPNTLYQAYRPFFGRTVFFLAIGFLGRISLLGNTNLIGIWVDSFCKAPLPCKPLPHFFAGFGQQDFIHLLAAATISGFALTLFYRIGLSRLSAQAVSHIYDETTLRTSRLPMTFFDRNPAGRIITRFSSDYNNVFRVFGGPLAEFIGIVFDMIAMTILVSIASPWYLPFWVGIAALNFLAYRLNISTLRKERRDLARLRSPGIAHFAETAQGAPIVRAYGKQDSFSTRFRDLTDAYLSKRIRVTTVFARFALSLGSITAVMFVVTGFFGIWLVKSGRASLGSIGVAFTYIGLSTSTLQNFFEWLAQFEEALTGLERMDEYLRLPLEPGAKLPVQARFDTGHPKALSENEKAPLTSKLNGLADHNASVEVQDLWMRYSGSPEPVLNGVSFHIAPGEKVAVIGRTGSGKTSLVQALFRLYPIEKGTIRLGGMEPRWGEGDAAPRSIDLLEYRRLIAFITQDPTLFLGTLADNLAIEGSRDTGELVRALRRVEFLSPTAADEDYRKLLTLPIEERGRNLSAGERQLICMARCLLQDSPIVIMDEATSAVDPHSESILNRATQEFFAEKTQIIIAHRLSTIQHCDRVLWLEGGKIRRMGPPSEVLPDFRVWRNESNSPQ